MGMGTKNHAKFGPDEFAEVFVAVTGPRLRFQVAGNEGIENVVGQEEK